MVPRCLDLRPINWWALVEHCCWWKRWSLLNKWPESQFSVRRSLEFFEQDCIGLSKLDSGGADIDSNHLVNRWTFNGYLLFLQRPRIDRESYFDHGLAGSLCRVWFEVVVSNRRGRLNISPPLKQVKNLPFVSWKLFSLSANNLAYPEGRCWLTSPIKLKNSMYSSLQPNQDGIIGAI